ncbi:Regulator of chromosome condensation rcc1 [Thalictrum thalictroides]|uniref:Regulator of chromosome condensation rcc1 n=1 Tax=Thalictrum thalictroides TaxID=46969 RepID=A0A7J6WT53_THATH|nr:Regulator of chromosome condensation rcc1 [Thalictrum thalictroides]
MGFTNDPFIINLGGKGEKQVKQANSEAAMMLVRQLLKKKTELKTNVDPFVVIGSCCNYSSSTTNGNGGVVMSFGDGSHGALGLPSSSIGLGIHAFEPTKIPNLPSNITSIGAGHYHSLALTAQGEVWAWGRNNEFQLGRGKNGSFSTSLSWNEPKKVEGLEQVRVTRVFGSGVVSAAIGDDGSLWVWGKSKRGQLGIGKGVIESALPTRVDALAGEHIVKVSLGWGHALAYTEDGKLFGWGYCADGRLGQIRETALVEGGIARSLPSLISTSPEQQSPRSLLDMADKIVLEQMEKEKDMPIVWEPCLLQETRDVLISDVACGDDHSLLLSCSGALLSGGSNTYGQLGRPKEELGMSPVQMKYQPLSISSGLGHSLAVCQIPSSQGSGILTWGWNSNSQLGRAGPENIPMLVQGLEGERPVSVAGGRVHSIALTSKGELWVWGCGKNGRLGLGSSADEVEPIMVDYLEGLEVLQAVNKKEEPEKLKIEALADIRFEDAFRATLFAGWHHYGTQEEACSSLQELVMKQPSLLTLARIDVQ